jgi:hypothetical protein
MCLRTESKEYKTERRESHRARILRQIFSLKKKSLNNFTLILYSLAKRRKEHLRKSNNRGTIKFG